MPPRPVPEDALVDDAPGGATAASIAELGKRLTPQAEALEKRLAEQSIPAGAPAPEGGEQGAQEPLSVEMDALDTELEYVDFAYFGMLRNPNKGVWEPTQVGPHLGLIVDLQRGEFRAPEEKLIALAKAARSLLGRAASNKRWLPARQLASFAGKAQFLYSAVTPARFFLRELHCVLATRQGWGGRVKMTNQLRRDLEWWTQVHAQHNGRSMYKPVETAYLHADSSSYGWGAVLNNNNAYQARGFWYEDDRSHHITGKELRAVRHAVESFLPHLRGRRVLLHEDNTAVVAALTNLTSRSPVMMEELRKLWHLLDMHCEIQM
eukprot:jgi/Tetstr1/428227/TSEL_018267.t1